MAPQGSKKRVALRSGKEEEEQGGLMTRLSESAIVQKAKGVVNDTSNVAKKLAKSTGKAAWYVGTTFLILVVPLIIQLDRDQMYEQMFEQPSAILGSPVVAVAPQ